MKKVLSILALVILFYAVISPFAVKSEDEKRLICNKNGDFVMLVVSDPQCDTESQWREARDELEILVKKAEPDFVLINGDMNSYNKVPYDMWDLFISPLESRGIYWSTTNGNHDPFKYINYKMYKNYEYCLNSLVSFNDANFDSSRPMNYVLPVFSNDGKRVVFAIYGMDSGTSNSNGYEGLTKKQIEWYKQQSNNLKQANGGIAVTSVLCMHIPLPQTLEMYYGGDSEVYGIANEIKYNSNGYICKNGKVIKKINIHTSSVDCDNQMFEAILQNGDIKAVLFGHNHRNNFIGSYNGVLLGFVGKLSTGCYSDTVCRGGRVIRFNQDNPQDFTTEWIGSLDSAIDQPAIYSNGTVAK